MHNERGFKIALAYFQQQDVSKLTPEEAIDKFIDIYNAMQKRVEERESSEVEPTK
ncbi:MAG: hypothetical protein IJ766_03785 [Clostridia bacterium]|nr:hypothetical protein [Clostridia bacterium]